MTRLKKSLQRLFVLSLPLLLSVTSASAQSRSGRAFKRLFDVMDNVYFLYFFVLFGVTISVAMITKASIEYTYLKDIIKNERHRSTLAAIIGIGTANGIFFALRRIKSVDDKLSQIVSIFLGFIAVAFLVGAVINLVKYLKEGET